MLLPLISAVFSGDVSRYVSGAGIFDEVKTIEKTLL
jgi:hypothetical protein